MYMRVKISQWYRCAHNPGDRLPMQLTFVLWAPNICGSLVWHLLLLWRLEFASGWKIFGKFVFACSSGYHENCCLKCDAVDLVDLSQHFCGTFWPQQDRRVSDLWSRQIPLIPAFVSTNYTVSNSEQRQSSAKITVLYMQFLLFSISGKAGLCTK
jgi:hypothetical protein